MATTCGRSFWARATRSASALSTGFCATAGLARSRVANVARATEPRTNFNMTIAPRKDPRSHFLVPTLCLGTHVWDALRPVYRRPLLDNLHAAKRAAERPGCVPTRSVGTRAWGESHWLTRASARVT